MGRDILAAAKRIELASDSELHLLVQRDPSMLRDIAKAYREIAACQLCHGEDPECKFCGGAQNG